MLLSQRVLRDLELEVASSSFQTFFRESLAGHAAFAGLEGPEDLLRLLRSPEEKPRREAALRALLQAFHQLGSPRARVGSLLLIALWPDLKAVVTYEAARLSRRAGFTRSDRDDLEQTLLLDVLHRISHYDPARSGIRTFLSRLVGHQVLTLIESRQAACRDWRRCRTSLQDPVLDSEGRLSDLGQLLDQQRDPGSLGPSPAPPPQAADLAADLKAALRSLPPHLRALSDRLKTSTPSELARAIGVPRTTLLKRMARIRAHLERAGLAQYLPAAASTRRAPR